MSFEIFKNKVSEIKEIDFGTKIIFDSNSFPDIPEFITTNDVFIELRRRFVSNGLTDNLIIHLSKVDSISFGLWILGSYFQKTHKKYTLKLSNEKSVIKEVWIDFRGDKFIEAESDTQFFVNDQNIQVTLNKFVWTADSVEDLVDNCAFYFDQKISLYVTNDIEEYFNMERFYERDVLIGFGEVGAGCLAAEFFLNLGLEKSDVNYDYIKYEFRVPSLADESSCEIRAEIIHDANHFEIESQSNNN